MSIARLKATEPVAVAELKSNPCVLFDAIFVPDFLSTAGSNPSNPSWKGTANFL